jgi:hypothetical protein
VFVRAIANRSICAFVSGALAHPADARRAETHRHFVGLPVVNDTLDQNADDIHLLARVERLPHRAKLRERSPKIAFVYP